MKCGIWLLAVAVVSGMTASAMADALLVDRGLPTANLNNAAGANRSNVAWADSEGSATPTEYWLPGDDFTISGSGNYHVSTIRVWAVGSNTGFSLLGGLSGGTMSTLSSSFAATNVTYANSEDYQKTDGSTASIYQIDFSVNLDLAAGQTFDFFVDGPWISRSTYFVNTSLHASNAALSGSTQQGADDAFQWLHVNGATQTVESWYSGTGAGTAGFSAGWDKNSDANVQVFGAAVPLPAAFVPGLALLAGLGVVGKIRSRRSKVA